MIDYLSLSLFSFIPDETAWLSSEYGNKKESNSDIFYYFFLFRDRYNFLNTSMASKCTSLSLILDFSIQSLAWLFKKSIKYDYKSGSSTIDWMKLLLYFCFEENSLILQSNNSAFYSYFTDSK